MVVLNSALVMVLPNHRLKLAARGTLTAGKQRRRSHAAA
jgi:hypothetical protein